MSTEIGRAILWRLAHSRFVQTDRVRGTGSLRSVRRAPSRDRTHLFTVSESAVAASHWARPAANGRRRIGKPTARSGVDASVVLTGTGFVCHGPIRRRDARGRVGRAATPGPSLTWAGAACGQAPEALRTALR